jgi:hypothetical protein
MIGRITSDGAIVPIWVTEGLVPPDPWSRWLKSEPTEAPAPTARAA